MCSWLVGPVTLNRVVFALTQHEQVEDPRDLVAATLRHASAQLSVSAELFASPCLVAHGFVEE